MSGCNENADYDDSDVDDSGLPDYDALQEQLAKTRDALGSDYRSLSQEDGGHRASQPGQAAGSGQPGGGFPLPLPTAADRPTATATATDSQSFELYSLASMDIESCDSEDDDIGDLFGEFDVGRLLTEMQSVLGADYRSLQPLESALRPGSDGGVASGSLPCSQPVSPGRDYRCEATALKVRNLRKHEAILVDALSANRKAQKMLRSEMEGIENRLEGNESVRKLLKNGLKSVRLFFK